MTMPRLTGNLQPRINWPTLASSVSITHPILRIRPRRTTTFSLDLKKTNYIFQFSSDTVDIADVEAWLDGLSSELFWVACKS
jgi:hypothetical protein